MKIKNCERLSKVPAENGGAGVVSKMSVEIWRPQYKYRCLPEGLCHSFSKLCRRVFFAFASRPPAAL